VVLGEFLVYSFFLRVGPVSTGIPKTPCKPHNLTILKNQRTEFRETTDAEKRSLRKRRAKETNKI